ncbi:hypothetical protein K474DRAFT_1685556 [Panus rudis PR-1116 ss-1]|nr:hypothetical protein K474DRAFT_1685556 [Panus rudis PR-1116 ss-1]
MSEGTQTLIQAFYSSFQTARTGLIKAAGQASAEATNQLALDVAKLRKDLTDATEYLPLYDQRQYDSFLKSVEQTLAELRTSSAPKPKFTFKRKQGALPAQSTPKPQPTPTSTASQASTAVDEFSSPSTGRILSNRSKEFLTTASLPSAPYTSTDLTITNLDHCILNLISLSDEQTPAHNKITALHVRDVSNCILLFPANIKGSAMLHNLTQCIIVLGCHQFRMHTSSRIHVYLNIPSNPIIEHCSDISFTGYPTTLLPTPESQATDVVVSSSNHLAVQDFSHIRSTASPNWRVLPDDARVPEDAWPSSSDVDIDRVLRDLLPT